MNFLVITEYEVVMPLAKQDNTTTVIFPEKTALSVKFRNLKGCGSQFE